MDVFWDTRYSVTLVQELWKCISAIASPTLKEVRLQLISPDVCKRPDWMGSLYYESIQICAGYAAGGRSTCFGDSGGPLQCMSSDGRWKLVGLTSFSKGCARPRKPSVFTRVASLVKWINNITHGMHIYSSSMRYNSLIQPRRLCLIRRLSVCLFVCKQLH